MARVALLTTNLARGGAETQVARLAFGLRRRGWETAAISLVPPTAFRDELEQAGVPVHTLGMKAGTPDPRSAVHLARILRGLRPQVLHSHMFHANLLARLIRTVCWVPVSISTLHSLNETPRDSREARARDVLYRLTDPLAETTVAVSTAVAERHRLARAVPQAKLRVIQNGVDTARFRPDPEARARVREQLGLGSEFAWLAAGRLMWKKDYPTLLRAFAMLASGVLLIAGTGPQEAELRGLVSSLRANVRFLGQRNDMADLFAAADAFVLSSVVEGLPVALLEAAASALPAVATDAGGVGEAIVPGCTGWIVPPGDAEALHAAMRRLAELPCDARRSMGEAARAHAIAHFDMDAIVARWEDLYRELLEKACAWT